MNARQMIRNILEDTSGDTISIPTRYGIGGWSPKLTSWLLKGHQRSFLDKFLSLSYDNARAKKIDPDGDHFHNYAMDAVITAFVDDMKINRRSEWSTEILPEIRKEMDKWLLGTSPQSRGYKGAHVGFDASLDGLEQAVRNAIERVTNRATFGKGTITFPPVLIKENDPQLPPTRVMLSEQKFNEAILLGASMYDLDRAAYHILGDRYTDQMARALNHLMSGGQEGAARTASRVFNVDDIVWLREDARAWASWATKGDDIRTMREGLAPGVTERMPERGVVGETTGDFYHDYSAIDLRVDNRNVEDYPAFRRDLDIEKHAAKVENLQPMRILRIRGMDSPSGPATKAEASEGVRVDLWDPNSKSVKEGVPLTDLVHRDVSFSILDAMNGASILGLEILDSIGRPDARKHYRSMYAASQKIVTIGVSSDGYTARKVPEFYINHIVRNSESILKEIDQAQAVATARTARLPGGQFGPIRWAYTGVGSVALNMFRTAIMAWKTAILVGTFIPRPGFFTSQHAGDLTQAHITLGFPDAFAITTYGALGYLPFGMYGQKFVSQVLSGEIFGLDKFYVDERSLRNKAELPDAVEPGRGLANIPLVPDFFSAWYHTGLLKLLEGSDDIIPQVGVSANELLAEADRANVRDSMFGPDIDAAVTQSLQRSLRLRYGQGTDIVGGINAAGRALQSIVPIGQMHRMMVDLIHETTTRQRLLLYADRRINKGDTPREAAEVLHATWFDWTNSVSKAEKDVMGQLVLFWTLRKNMLAQYFRMFNEFEDVGPNTYANRYVRGRTQLQRHRAQLMLQSDLAPKLSMTETSDKDEIEYAHKLHVGTPDYIRERAILEMGELSDYAQNLQLGQGYDRPYWARVAPPSSSVDSALLLFHLFTAGRVMAMSVSNFFNSDNKAVSLSTNVPKAMDKTAEVIADIMTPAYAFASEAILAKLLKLSQWPQSWEGRPMRPGDQAMLDFANSIHLGWIASTTEVEEPGEKKNTKRIAFNLGPLSPIFDFYWNLYKPELMRAHQAHAIIFPDKTHEEVLIYAEENPTDYQLRIKNALELYRVFPTMSFNPIDVHTYREEDIEHRATATLRALQLADRAVVHQAPYETKWFRNLPQATNRGLTLGWTTYKKEILEKNRDVSLRALDTSELGQRYYLMKYGPDDLRLTDEFKTSKIGQELLNKSTGLRTGHYPVEEIQATIDALETYEFKPADWRK
jgi:hypothetical protein